MGRLLLGLHVIAMALLALAVAMGYAARGGSSAVGAHIWSGFLIALIVGFTHAMTLFYFAGMGVSLREAAGRRAEVAGLLERAGGLRRRLATPLGLALVAVMAATIVGGGAHTRFLPQWPHHALSIAALALNLWAGWIAIRSIRQHEALVVEMETALATAGRVERAKRS